MGSLRDLFAKRRMFITAHDAIVILSQESPFFCKLSPSTQEVIAKTGRLSSCSFLNVQLFSKIFLLAEEKRFHPPFLII